MNATILREIIVRAGFRGLQASGVCGFAGGAFRGLGAILMLHHVRPARQTPSPMNQGLEISPEFLAQAIEILLELGFDLISLDEAVSAIRLGERERPFAVLSFDDGYLDNLIYAVPVLRRFGAPFTIYVSPGFTDGAVGAWWEDLDLAIVRLSRIALELPDQRCDLPASSVQEKRAAGRILGPIFRALPDALARSAAADLLAASGGGPSEERLFMSWEEIAELATDPLCTIGVHTIAHPRLAGLALADARGELVESRRRIEEAVGRPARHAAYPYGGPDAAAAREFLLAQELGFASATTTRPGMIFPEHARHLTALPRLSVNGAWQDRAALATLLSGLPFALWNRGRRLNVA